MLTCALLTLIQWQLLIVQEPVPPTPQELEDVVELLFPSALDLCCGGVQNPTRYTLPRRLEPEPHKSLV